MKEKYADLHVHTYYSDSTFSPEEVVRTAKKVGLKTIAICDHDCVDAIEQCIEIGRDYDIEIIPGVELTCEKEGTEIHMLGYLIDWKEPQFKEKLSVIQKSRIERIYKMTELLKEKGISIEPEDVFEISARGTVGRLHVAMAMQKKKKIHNLQEAFDKYIGYEKPCYVSHIKFDPKDAIESILKVGGVPVLAHPAVSKKDECILEFIKYGLRGIEVYHSDHDVSEQQRYLKIARQNGLIAAGGSDCHGLGKRQVLLGKVKMPYLVVEELKEEVRKVKSQSFDRAQG